MFELIYYAVVNCLLNEFVYYAENDQYKWIWFDSVQFIKCIHNHIQL